MTLNSLSTYIVISELVSILLMLKIWRSKEGVFFKIIISALTLVPFVGPIFCLFVMDDTEPRSPELQNRGARGDYTHSWIIKRKVMKKLIDEKQREEKT